jgi:hypothetical protein
MEADYRINAGLRTGGVFEMPVTTGRTTRDAAVRFAKNFGVVIVLAVAVYASTFVVS